MDGIKSLKPKKRQARSMQKINTDSIQYAKEFSKYVNKLKNDAKNK